MVTIRLVKEFPLAGFKMDQYNRGMGKMKLDSKNQAALGHRLYL